MSTNYKNPNGRMIRILLLSIAALLCMSSFALPATAADGSSAAVTDAQLMNLNVPFIANSGQQPDDVKFYADTFFGRVFVTNVDLTHAVEVSTDDGVRGVALKEQFVAANDTVISFIPAGEDMAETKVSYFIGNDASTWQTGLPAFNLVSLGEIWPGITVKAQAHGATVEKLFTVAPGASPETICVKVQGADSLRIADDGSLVIVSGDSEASMTAPKAFQDGHEVPVAYRVLDEGMYGFTVGEYNRKKALLIDPSLAYSTYLGGSDRDYGYSIAVDTAGSAYVGGYAYSTDFPTTTGAYQITYGSGTSDAFVTKLNPDGSGLAYSTYLGGSLVDQMYGIAVDSSGNAYIAGYTTSSDFPTTVGAYNRTLSGSQDGIVVKLNPSGTSLLYSTYLGGAAVVYSSQGQEEIDGITVDSTGKIYVTGRTGASDFPVTAGAYNTTMPHTTGGSLFGFISIIDPAGSGTGDLTYSTYLGGDMGTHYSRAIVLDSSGMIYVAGQTTSDIFPVTTGAFQMTKQCAGDNYNGFLSKLNPAGSGTGDLVYSTYLAGTDGPTYPRGIGVDGAGIYVAGYTASTDFPTTTGAYQTTNAGGNDAFVCIINPAGSAKGDLVYSTYFGGTGTDYGYGSALDNSGTVYLTGPTYSSDFPTTTDASQTSLSGTRDAFVVKINPAGSGTGDLVYSTYLGGTGTDVGYAIALDSGDNAYVTGSTASTDFPVTTGASQATYGGGSYDAFVTKISFASATIPPVAAFTSNDQTGDAPLTVQFTDLSANDPTDWAWDFENDGTVDSTEQSPSHIYDTAGTYTVNLTVTNAEGSDSEVKMDYITVTAAGPKTWYVDDSGGADFTTIKSAIAAASAGDTLFILPGTYLEAVSVTKPFLTIQSAGADLVTIDCLRSTAIEIPSGGKENVTGTVLDGFTIINSSNGLYIGNYGNANNSIIRNCVIKGITSYVNIKGSNITFENNTWINTATPSCALMLNAFTTNCTILNNKFINITPVYGAIILYKTTTTNNIISGNEFNNNKIYFNDAAVNNQIYLNNNISGVAIKTGIVPDLTYWNATTPITYIYNGASYTGYPGNFWSNCTGTDTDGDGIIDTPNVLPSSLGTDYAPLMGAWNNGEITYSPPAVIAPVAIFSSDVQTGTAPLTVQFTDASSGTPTSWAWDFTNDGTVDSTELSPSHIYDTAGTYTVNLTVTNAGGSDSEVKTDYITVTGGGGPKTWHVYEGQSIQDAINGASDGDTVFVHAGTYLLPLAGGGDSHLSVDKPNIHLKGEGADVVTLDGGGSGIAIYVGVSHITPYPGVAAPGCIVDGFRIVNSGIGIIVNVGSPDCIIRNNVIEVSGDGATTLSPNTTIEDNIFHNCFLFIESDPNTASSMIRGNRFEEIASDWSFYIKGDNQTFIDNIVSYSAAGGEYNSLFIVHCTNSLIANNTFRNSSLSPAIVIYTEESGFGGNTITRNNFTSNYGGIGIELYEALSVPDKVYLNNFNSTNNVIVTAGITPSNILWTSTSPIEYTYNGATYTGFLGNYWSSDYTGADAEGNGIGDTAFTVPDSLGSDTAPLMGAWNNGEITYTPPAVIAPVAAFISDVQTNTAPLTVNFTDQSTNTPTSWAWDINNDGTVEYTTQNATHIFTTAGNYTVNLTVTNAGGSDSEVKIDYITVTAAGPKTWYVDDSGGADFTTIQAAVDAATDGDTIIVRDGTYPENMVVDRRLAIRSENGADSTTVQTAMTGSATPVIQLTADYVTLSGFTVNGLGPLAYDPAAVGTALANGIEIASNHTTVTGNTALGCAYGIHLSWRTSNNTVSYNNCSWNRDHGIKMDMSSGNTVTHNICRGTWHDDNIDVTSSSDNLIADNLCIDGLDDGIWLDSSSNNRILNNTCENNAETGIHKTDTGGSSNIISNNTCRGNTLNGIQLLGTGGDTVTYNTLSGNGKFGITIAGTGNNIYLNNVMGNGLKATGSPGNIWNSTEPIGYTYNGATYTDFLGNYWGSDYTGSDADGNGIGDVSYTLSDGSDDYRPLIGEFHDGEITFTPPAVISPVAAFTSDVQTGTVPLTVNFTDQSTNTPTSWAWDVNNDGTVDYTTRNATHTYAAAGTYTVNLTVTNAGGNDSEVKTDYITISPPAPALLWGPYLTGTTTTGTVVNVKTNIATAVTVEYATDAYYQANSGYDQSATDSVSTQLHHVSLAGLTPDTLYHYRVVYAGQPTTDFHISTFPESGAFIFVMYSDTQDQLPTYSQLERHKLVADRIAEEPDIAFVLNSGDLVNDASDLANWDRYFAAGSMMMANTTVYPALGNHDNNDPNYYQNYGVPEYYSFDCADAHVAVLDSNDWAWNDLPVQSAWLANDLQTDKPFKFISFHHPLYTSEAKHFGGWENLRLEWEDDFIDNGVLAVFNGHVHAYERFLVNNITYFVAGIGGGPSYYLQTPRYTGSQNSLEGMLGYIKVTVDPAAGTATAQVIRVADVLPDNSVITYPPGTVFETVVMSLPELPVAPTAAFTTDVQTGTAPLTVQFTDTSTGTPTSWAWDFTNDGSVDSTEQSPSHVYDTAGTYTVNLTVTNTAGSDAEVKTDYITVSGPALLPVLNVNTGVRYTTIQAAVTAAVTGDKIIVGDGSYIENIDIDKQLLVRSENGSASVTVTAASPTLPVFDVNANGVTIQGFTVRGPTNEHVAGIEIVDYNDGLVSGNDCAGCYNGIHIGGTGMNNTISENYCHENTRRGISVRDTAHDNLITLNTAGSNTDAGICIKDQSYNNVLWLNDVIGNRVEILTENIAHSPNPITYTYKGGTYTSYLGNYYFDYSGTDIDGNGVGTPAYSYGTHGDGYPLMDLYANYVETTPIAPTAVFTADVMSGTVPLTVQFTDASTGTPTSWAWDFENDGTVDSTAQSPSHTYSTVGTYTVKLTVTNTAGSDDEVKTDYISVSSAVSVPVAAYSGTPTSGTAPVTVHFTDASTGTPTTWAWDFTNDGTIDSTEQNPSHIYDTAGTYTVNLTVTNATGSDSEVKTGYITVSSPSSGTALLIRPAAPSVIVGETRTVNIVLSEAADGLAGYNITISLADGTKAEITAVSFPGWAGVNQQSTVPGDSIWMKGLDLNKQVEAGASEVILATLTIRGDQLGTTTLRADAIVMDDDDGTAMDPVAAEESLSVIQQVPQLPGYPAPTDPDGDGLYEDLNGNGRIDFNDVVVYFNNMEWISVQDGFGYFDFNRNGRIDFDDVVRLFWGV